MAIPAPMPRHAVPRGLRRAPRLAVTALAGPLVLLAASLLQAANGHGMPSGNADKAPPKHLAWTILALVALISLSALFAGLGLGIMSLDLMGLEIVVATGEDENATRKEKQQGAAARRIIPIRRKGNLLLTTLLIGNVAVNSLTSILMADVTSGLAGFLISTTVIVLFGEIVPQAICTQHALEIGSKVVPLVHVTIAVFYVFAKPISMVLDAVLGKEVSTIFTKHELTEMIEIHAKQHAIEPEESDILRGAMSYASKTAKSIMTPMNQLFMLPISLSSELLDFAMFAAPTVQKILDSGYSRIPIYGASADDIISVLYVKDLIFVDPKQEAPLASFLHIFGRSVHQVGPECPLGVLLQTFKTERPHLALVQHISTDHPEAGPEIKLDGIVTLEDVLEEILQSEILDEQDIPDSRESAERKRRLSCLYVREGRLSLAGLCSAGGRVESIETLAQRLQRLNPIFRSNDSRGVPITAAALAKFLSSCSILEFGDDGDDAPLEIFTRGVATRFCVVVLEGRLRVDAVDGSGAAREVGPWSVLAADSLVMQEGLYCANASVRTLPGVSTKILRIARADFQRELHPLRPTKSSESIAAVAPAVPRPVSEMV